MKTKGESKSLAKAKTRTPDRTEWLKVPKIKKLDPGRLELESNHPESLTLFKDAVRQATGLIDDTAASSLLLQATLTPGSLSRLPDACNTVLALLYGISPKDTLEGMLAVQMVTVHMLAMKHTEWSASDKDTSAEQSKNVGEAVKLMNLFTRQLEALSKHRNKGRQRVTVEHVHVNEGGQAIVGLVAPEGEARGQ